MVRPSVIRHVAAAGFFLVASLAPPVAAAGPEGTKPTDYSVFPLAESASATTLVVPDDGLVTLYLSRSGAVPEKPETLDLTLTPFKDARGQIVPVALLLRGAKAEKPVRSSDPQTVSVDVAHLPLQLHVGPIPSPRSVAGHLLLSRGGAHLKSYAITLAGRSSDRGAKLKLDRTTASVQVTEGLFGYLYRDPPIFSFLKREPPQFSVSVRDESGDWPLGGLHARLEEAKSPGDDFDPMRDVRFLVNDREVKDFWLIDESARDDPARAVPAGGQAKIVGKLPHDLAAGQYKAKIRFLAANSQDDQGQVLTLEVNVRKSLPYAIAFLLLGILVSLVVTVVLKSRAAMLRLRLRILQTRPAWLAAEPATLVVTWVRSIFGQGEALQQHFTVAATSILEERMAQAAQHLPYLSRLSALRDSIDRSGWERMVRRRAKKVLQRINARLVTGALNEKTGASILAEIDLLNAWSTDGFEEPYWKDLKKDIDGLLTAVDPNAFEGPARTLVDDLMKVIGDPKQPAGVSEMIYRENRYAALKLLWERAGDKVHENELARLWNDKGWIDDLFKCADRAAWHKLKEHRKELRFVRPQLNPLEPIQPFEPLVFEVGSDMPGLCDNFLFKHNLRYEWEIFLGSPERSGWSRRLRSWWSWVRRTLGFDAAEKALPPLTPRTEEPQVYVYSPHKCQMSARVVLRFLNDSLTVPDDTARDDPKKPNRYPVPVAGFAFRRLMRSVETMEMLSLGLAVIVGVASGLLTQYFGNATFGSPRDLIAIFLWGAGADQASKSFVAVISLFPRWSEAETAADHSTRTAAGASSPPAQTAPSKPDAPSQTGASGTTGGQKPPPSLDPNTPPVPPPV